MYNVFTMDLYICYMVTVYVEIFRLVIFFHFPNINNLNISNISIMHIILKMVVFNDDNSNS